MVDVWISDYNSTSTVPKVYNNIIYTWKYWYFEHLIVHTLFRGTCVIDL